MRVAGRLRPGRRRYARRRPAGRAPPAGWPGPAPEIVPQVVPVGLQDVEGPVPDLPPCASAGGDFGDIGVRDVEVGDEAVAAGHPAAGPGGPDLEPGDVERIGAVAQGRVGHPPVSVGTFGRTPACGPADLLRLRALQVFAQRPVARRPAYEDEGCRRRPGPLRRAGGGSGGRCPNGPAAARPRKARSAPAGAALRGSRSPVCRARPGGARTPAPTAGPDFGPAQPSTRGRSCGSTPLHRQHGASGTDRSAACGTENAPNRPTPPTRACPDTAYPTAPRTSPDPKRSPETRRRSAPADVVVARDVVHAERRLRVRDTPTLRKGTPVRQKGRTPHGKRRKADIAHRIPTVAPGPPVRQRRAPIAHKPCAAFELMLDAGTMPEHERGMRPAEPPRMPPECPFDPERPGA